MLKKIKRKIKKLINNISKFDKNNQLGSGGERVDIIYKKKLDYSKMDMYQKNHYRRYKFALSQIYDGDICGDFACGTGYGCAMLSKKAAYVIGADINGIVIEKIRERYKKEKNIEFLALNLLDIKYECKFDRIISFETIEHFKEEDIITLFRIFCKALKPDGTIIFSTPFMQERSEAAINMGFHKTFYIDQDKIKKWLAQTDLILKGIRFQNYETHLVRESLDKKDFIICTASQQ
jgi:2-polyprenyl-3-methyl-5-hydroxy-6-metoxy-1,4-benzoquinol methylase